MRDDPGARAKFENDWGMRAPAPGEVERAYESNYQALVDRAVKLMAESMDTMQASLLMDMGTLEVMEATENGDIFTVDLGDAGKFIPRWQFRENGAGNLEVMQGVKKLSETWNKGNYRSIDFHEFMTREEFQGRGYTAAEMLAEDTTGFALATIQAQIEFINSDTAY